MRVLAIDTTGPGGGAALLVDGVVQTALVPEEIRRGRNLVPLIDGLLKQAGVAPSDLDLVACGVGPGSFTGIRAGLAAARGIALARALPVLGIDTFATVLWGVDRTIPDGAGHRLRVIALDSRRKEIYLRIFSPLGAPVSEPAMVAPDDVAPRIGDRPIVLAGSAADGLERVLGATGLDVLAVPGRAAPDAGDLAGLAAVRIAARQPGEAVPLPAPLYLHPPYAVRPAGGGKLRP